MSQLLKIPRSVPVFLFSMIAVLAASSAAQTTTWTAATNTLWSVASNWTNGVPTATTDVVIPAATPGVATTIGASAICRNIVIDAGAFLIVPTGSPLECRGNFDLQGLLAVPGLLRFTGSGTQTVSAAPTGGFFDIEIASSGLVIIESLFIVGGLTLNSGQCRFNGGTNIFGAAQFNGGALSPGTNLAGTPVLHCQSTVTFAGTVDTTNNLYYVTGSWSSDANFNPTSPGLVIFKGPSPQTVQVSGSAFYHAVIYPTTTVDIIGGPLSVQGGFLSFSPAPMTPTSVLRMVGAASFFPAPQGGPIANLQLATLGSCSMEGFIDVTGSFSLLSGDMVLENPSQLTIGGAAVLSGGSLIGADSVDSRLVLAGSVTFSGTNVGTAAPLILSLGDWTSDASFFVNDGFVGFSNLGTQVLNLSGSRFNNTVVSGVTTLDLVTGPMDIRDTIENYGVFTPGGLVRFVAGSQVVSSPAPLPSCELVTGSFTMTSDVTLTGSLTIDGPATFANANKHLTVLGPQVEVLGALSLGATAELTLGSATAVHVAVGGSLSLIGALGLPAVVDGAGGGGYSFLIDGGLAARFFHFRDMGPQGIVISPSATLAAAPHDFRLGSFDFSSPLPGAAQLDVQRSVPTSLWYLDFLNTPNHPGPSNVRCLGGATINMVNAAGIRAGAAFEIDPGSRVDWTTSVTTLAAFTAIPGREKATVSFTTSAEVDTDLFTLERGPTASGPFTTLTTFLPAGPSTYPHLDQPLAGNLTYFYRLSQHLVFGPTQILGTVSACPWSSALPPNVWSVGAGGAYGDIQSALNAITTGSPVILKVAAGTYPSFTVNDVPSVDLNIHIIADGSGPVTISTTSGPISFGAFNFYDRIYLKGLEVGSPASPSSAVAFNNSLPSCIVFDACTLTGGAGQPGVTVHASHRLSFQDCSISGTPGIRGTGTSMWVMSRGSLSSIELNDSCYLRTCQLSAPSTVGPLSVLTDFAGMMPHLGGPDFQPLGTPFILNIEGDPTSIWYIGIAPTIDWYEVFLPGWTSSMVGLITISTPDFILGFGTTDAFGTYALSTALPADKILLGTPVPLQMAVFNPLTSDFRWSNVLSIISMP